MTRVSKAPLGHVEMYAGVEHRYQLRIPYRVQVYEIFPTHRYNASIWIGLNGSGDVLDPAGGKARSCPEGASFDPASFELRGVVNLEGDSARIALEEHRYEKDAFGWHPFEFNGTFRLVRPSESPIEVARAEAEAIARDAKFSTIWYCKPLPIGHLK
jgi:hypothetical protein